MRNGGPAALESHSEALNFLWNLLTIKYEPARSVILNFKMCPPDLAHPIRGECHPISGALSRETPKTGTSFAGCIHHLQRAAFNFHERFRIPDARSKRKTARKKDVRTVYRAREGAREVIPEEKVLRMKGIFFYGIILRGINHRASVGRLYVGERRALHFLMHFVSGRAANWQAKESIHDYGLWILHCRKILSDLRTNEPTINVHQLWRIIIIIINN